MWTKTIASWKIQNILYISIPFTWLIPEARILARNHKGKVIVGGPAAYLMEDEVEKWASVEHEISFVSPIEFHNPLATFTTRGCINKCKFCAVPIIEGDFYELKKWNPRPYICDNNFLASSKKHIKTVIESLKRMPIVDFNQGLDIRLLKGWHLDEFAKLKQVKLRFAFDHINSEAEVYSAISKTQKAGYKNIGVYVLIGFNDTPDEAKYKLDKVIEWGAQPAPMRYQPLNCLEKNSFVGENWNHKELSRMVRYYFRQNWLSKIPYEDYNPPSERKGLFNL